MSYPKKLIEVALPLEDINAASAKEKTIRNGHPSGLHLWWARRPLVAARAVLFSQLVDDPSGYVHELRNNSKLVKKSESELHKRIKDWRDKKDLFDRVQAGGGQGTNPGDEPTLDAILVELERERLFNMIRELVLWGNTTNERVLELAREEIRISWKRTCKREGKPEDTPIPPFLDPFAGGGAIPLEAQRLGLEVHASDLNPVAVLINKAMIEIPPKFADMPPVHPKAREEMGTTGWKGAGGLAEDVKRYGEWMREEAFKRIGHLYPPYKLTQELIDSRPDLHEQGYKHGDELTVIAWLQSRTIPSPNPILKGKHVPLFSSFWLSKKKGKEVYLEPSVEDGEYRFDIRIGSPTEISKVNSGTKSGRATFRCIITDTPINGNYIDEIAGKGRMKSFLFAVVCEGKQGRVYLPVPQEHVVIANEATEMWKPSQNCRGTFASNAQGRRYNFKTFGDYFTNRQLVTLNTFCEILSSLGKKIQEDLQISPYNKSDSLSNSAKSISLYLSFVIDKLADLGNSLNRWEPIAQCPRQLFGRQAISMIWDFAESNPFSNTSGSWKILLRGLLKNFQTISESNTDGSLPTRITQADARHVKIESSTVISTDPPYYDNIGYADLSDFFYVWLRKSVGKYYPDILQTILVPKEAELIADKYRQGGKVKAEEYFLKGMSEVIENLISGTAPSIPLTIYYAFKQSEIKEGKNVSTGWATFLASLINSDVEIISTWPLRTENTSRMIGQGTNALASSVVLVCRRKSINSPIASRKEFIGCLKRELPKALLILQQGNIAPVDLPQASIGPGMAIFSRYAKILEADGSEMSVSIALHLIDQELSEFFEDRETNLDSWSRFSITWFSQNKFNEGPYGDALNLATARNVTVDGVEQAGILKSGGGKVRLLKRDELDPNWDPATDNRLTVWEVTHYLIRELLDGGGEMAAAKLLKKVGGLAEDAKGLAYRLYTICEQNKWAELGRDYNMLVSQWPELVKQAQELESEQTTQSELGI